MMLIFVNDAVLAFRNEQLGLYEAKEREHIMNTRRNRDTDGEPTGECQS